MLINKKNCFAFLIGISCLPITVHAGFVGKTVTFLAGAALAPYINQTLFDSKPSFNLRSVHERAWPEVGRNLSNAQQNCKQWLTLVFKKLDELEQKNKKKSEDKAIDNSDDN